MNYDDKWNNMYELAKEYYEKNGHLEVQFGYVTSTGEKLGFWISNQRACFRLGKMTQDRKEKLELIGLRFETKDNKTEWNDMYELAKEYYIRNGNLEVPQKYVTSTGENLGWWISNQRKNFKNDKLSRDRIDKLLLIGMRFENNAYEVSWNKMYELAKEYYIRNCDLEVPSKYVTSTGENLGWWIVNQRSKFKEGKLTQERIEKLELIGMSFETKDNKTEWNKMYEFAREYYELNGDLEVPHKYLTLTGEKLGIWITNQRTFFKFGKLNQERIKKLTLIGMRFQTNYNEIEWEKMYELAKGYYEQNGNLEIPQKYVTSTGERLGMWVSTQRTSFKNDKLSRDRIDKLTLIGMRWTAKNKNSLQNKIELCMCSGIDYSKYKKDLDKISYQELYSKLCFLKDNNIPYIVNGELNNIFYMSSMNMKVEYGFSLEELCLYYYLPRKEKGNSRILKK